jgi:putative inorganic carbon (HCO3(-)) transporter
VHFGLEGAVPTTLWIAEFVFFFLSVFWRPSAGLYLAIPLMPLQTVRYRLHGYFLGEQFIDLLLLGVILGLRRQGRPIFPKTPLNGLLLTYIIFTYLSLVRGSFFLGVDLPLWFSDLRVSDWKNYVVDLALIFFVTVSAIRTKKEMGWLVVAMCLGSLMVAQLFNTTIRDRDFSAFSYDLRDAGPLGGAGVNGLAAFAAQMSVFVMGVWLVEKRFLAKLGYLGVIAASLYCLVFSLSRGGYAAFLAGIVFLGIYRSRLLLVALVFFLMGWQTIVPPAVRQRVLMTTDDQGGVEHSAASRLSLWEEAIQVFRADPVFGTGFKTYAFGEHVGGYGDTHNIFVKVLVETGVTGLLLFLAIFRKLFQIGFRLTRTATDPFLKSIGLGFAALMVAAFVGNLFGDRWMYFQITGYTYAFAALAFRAQQMTDHRAAEREAKGTERAELVTANA